MSWGIYQLLIGVHIFLAVIWVGGILFVGWGVYPAVRTMNPAQQRLFLRSLMKRTHWVFTLAGAGVIATGFLLGTVAGPIRHWSDLWNTRYGTVWLTSFMIAVAALIWGVFAGYRQTMKVLADDSIWILAENGDAKPLNKALTATAAVESVEVIGFVALIVCMILLR